MGNIIQGPGSIPTIGRIPVDKAPPHLLAQALDTMYGGRSMQAFVLAAKNQELADLVKSARTTLLESGITDIPTDLGARAPVPSNSNDEDPSPGV